MSLLSSILQQVEGSDALAGLAAKVGLPADQVQSIGDSLLAKIQGGSTPEQAAADTAARYVRYLCNACAARNIFSTEHRLKYICQELEALIRPRPLRLLPLQIRV